MSRLALAAVAFLGLMASVGSAQTRMTDTGGRPQSPPAGPPRDNRPASSTGTAVIRGRIVAADTGRPLRRARVRLTSPDLGNDPRTTSTDLDGTYELRELPAGRYTLQVTRSGYLTLNYGQRRPLEPTKPLQLDDKQVLDHVDFTLPRTSVIAGRLSDELVEPVADAQIFAMRQTYWGGRRRMIPAGPPGRTNDAGDFRLSGLTPGTYFVMATLRETWTVTEKGVEQTLGYAPTYFPGATALSGARQVTVSMGQESGGMDFSLMPGRTATVSGTAMDSHGAPLAGRRAALTQEISGPTGGIFMLAGNGTIGPDGSFSIANVSPGEYKLKVQTSLDANPVFGRGQEGATVPLVVDSVDLLGLSLMTSAGWSMSGQVVSEDGTPLTFPRERIRIAGRLMNGDSAPTAGPRNEVYADIKSDWTFSVNALFGPARLQGYLPDGWAVKAILHEGRDVADTFSELKSGEEMSSIRVVVTSRITTVSGQLKDEKGQALTDGTVIVFSPDSDKWSEESRWVRTARPDQQGFYQVKGLPAGEYLAVAVDYVEDGLWNDPEYLESLRRFGQRVTLGEGDRLTLSLRLATP